GPRSATQIVRLELYFRRSIRAFRGREMAFGFKSENAGHDVVRELPHGGVVLLRGFVKRAPFRADTVFRTFKLRLQLQEVLVGLQFGVALYRYQQAAQRLRKPVLRLLELLKGFRRQVFWVYRHGSGLGPGLDYLRQGLLLEVCSTLNGVYQVWNKVGTPLVSVFDLSPLSLDILVEGNHRVVAARAERKGDKQAC